MHKNSWDLLRLIAATMVLYSHQFALLGLPEPMFVGTSSVGTAGVAIFFFLSGFLVWSSWERDPHAGRFFVRRALRIFPALWVVCLLSVFVLGPVVSVLPLGDYFASEMTWRYLETAALNVPKILPGVFLANHYPQVVNGSLWTLPLEVVCYVTVAAIGLLCLPLTRYKSLLLALGLLFFLLLASLAPHGFADQIAPSLVMATRHGAEYAGFAYDRYAPHYEMLALFWWGVLYAVWLRAPAKWSAPTLAGMAFLTIATAAFWSVERSALLVFVMLAVHVAGKLQLGAKVTDTLGDLSYGVYIVAFPVQQLGVQWGRSHGWSEAAYFFVSVLATFILAYLSWHLVEKRALSFKPQTPKPNQNKPKTA